MAGILDLLGGAGATDAGSGMGTGADSLAPLLALFGSGAAGGGQPAISPAEAFALSLAKNQQAYQPNPNFDPGPGGAIANAIMPLALAAMQGPMLQRQAEREQQKELLDTIQVFTTLKKLGIEGKKVDLEIDKLKSEGALAEEKANYLKGFNRMLFGGGEGAAPGTTPGPGGPPAAPGAPTVPPAPAGYEWSFSPSGPSLKPKRQPSGLNALAASLPDAARIQAGIMPIGGPNPDGSQTYQMIPTSKDPSIRKAYDVINEGRQTLDLISRVDVEVQGIKGDELGVIGDWRNRLFGIGSQVSAAADDILTDSRVRARDKDELGDVTKPVAERAFGALYSPKADRLAQIRAGLVFKMASGYAGQGGRAMSDADVARAETLVGPWDSIESIRATLPNVKDLVVQSINLADQRTRFTLTPAGVALPGGGATHPAAPAAERAVTGEIQPGKEKEAFEYAVGLRKQGYSQADSVSAALELYGVKR